VTEKLERGSPRNPSFYAIPLIRFIKLLLSMGSIVDDAAAAGGQFETKQA